MWIYFLTKGMLMISLEYITDELKNEMKMNIADQSQYDTWIDILKPLNLFENTLYLEIPKSDMMFVYEKIWTPALQEALDKINKDNDYDLKVVIIAKDSDSYNRVLAMGKNYESNGQMRLKEVNKYPKPILDRNYTFENFVQGKSNQYAHAIASAVTQDIINDNPSKNYNPLFIYGESGLGKTHLMQAIAHKILEERDDLYVMYISSERFTNELIASIQPTSKNKNQNLNQEFRNKYRSADIQQFVAEKYNIKVTDLKGKSRKKDIVLPRHISMYLARDILDDSLVTISNAFERDHTTVMHGIDKIKEEMSLNPDFKEEIESLRKSITE